MNISPGKLLCFFFYIGKGTFCKEFLCKYLPEHGRDLVTLTEENEHFVLKLNDVDEISSCYYGFKESTTGKTLRRDPKRRKEIITKSMRDLEKKGFLKKFGDGREYGIPFLKYEVQDDELLDLLKSNYTVQGNAAMVIQTFDIWRRCNVCN